MRHKRKWKSGGVIPVGSVVYKKCNGNRQDSGVVVKLKVLEEGIVPHNGRISCYKHGRWCDVLKGKVPKAKVLSIDGYTTPGISAVSDYNPRFVYAVGTVVETQFNADLEVPCGEGIHVVETESDARGLAW